MELNPDLVSILNLWKRDHPFRGSISERQLKFQKLHSMLNNLYQKTYTLEFGPITPESESKPGSSAGVSWVNSATKTLHIEGRLSVITFLHEWGHVLFGHTETSAQDFAWIHFKECFPVSASRLQKVDDFFYTQKPRDQPQPTGGA